MCYLDNQQLCAGELNAGTSPQVISHGHLTRENVGKSEFWFTLLKYLLKKIMIYTISIPHSC